MKDQTNIAPRFGGALSTAEHRRLRELMEAIVKDAPRVPPMVYATRHAGAKYDAATVCLVRETCAVLNTPEARRAAILAGLAHLSEQRLALLSMLADEMGGVSQLVLEAQLRDLTEDMSEKKFDASPCASNAAQWLTDSQLAIAAEEAKCMALRQRALEAYAPRTRPAA